MASVLKLAGLGLLVGAGAFRIYEAEDLEAYDVSAACVSALSADITCNPYIRSFMQPSYRGSLDNVTFTDQICVGSCSGSLRRWFDSVSKDCGGETLGSSNAVPMRYGGNIWAGWNETCIKDPKTKKYCNDIIDEFSEPEDGEDMPREELCHICYQRRLAIMQSSQYSIYNEYYKEELERVYKTCGGSGPTEILPPVKPKEKKPEFCLTGEYYTTKEGDTCDSISKAAGVSGALLYMGNQDTKPSPTQDGLIDTCIAFYEAKKGDTCNKIIAQYKTFDFDDFFKWNPAVDKDCSGIWANTWYCVGVPGTPTSPPTKTIVTTTKPTGTPKPSQTQEGLIENCTTFHMAVKGDTCAKIVSKVGTFDFDTFYKWNPAVGKDCSGIWASYYYCVGVPGTATVKPSATTPKPTATGGVETPSPIQEGLVKNCNKFHQIASTTTCSSIESYYKLPLAQFLAWNPAVGKDCSSLWKGYWVCVSVEGYKPATTTTAKPTTTKPANGIATPSPIQDGMVKNCEKFHQIKSTTTCTSIENYYNLPLSTFLSWNPAVGKDCTSLLVNYWVCVATVGWKPPTKTTTKAATTTKSSSIGIKTPPPVQAGMVSNCNKFHMVQKTTTCDSIQNYYKISLADFVKWNPAVGKDCKGLWADYNVCVGVIGGTPTKPGNGVETPSPIQTGMVSNCKKFHQVQSTTTCSSIQTYYKITLAQLTKWNPAIGSKCTALWAKYWVCVGV